MTDTTRDAAIENQALRDFWKTWQVGLPEHLHGRPTSSEVWHHAWQAATAAEREKRQPLTADQISDMSSNYNTGRAGGDYDFARAIEAAHGIKQ